MSEIASQDPPASALDAGMNISPDAMTNAKETADGKKGDGTNKLEDSKVQKPDAYAYTARGEFTSENFKIEIRNMPRYYGVAQFRKFLQNTLKLNARKLKPVPGRGGGLYVTFQDEPTRQRALELLDGREWKKSKLTAKWAAAVADPFHSAASQKRGREAAASEESNAKRAKDTVSDSDVVSLEERAKQAVIPWWNVPYQEQLSRKSQVARDIFSSYQKQLRKVNFPLFKWLTQHPSRCTVDAIKPSPELECYRNKCEFTVGRRPDTGEPTVGFRLASYKDGSTGVAPVDTMPHVPGRMKVAASHFQQCVRESKYAPFDATNNSGYWRQLLARTSRSGELLLAVSFHPQTLSEQELAEVREHVRRYMMEGPGGVCGVTGLLWQNAGRLEAGQPQPFHLLAGQRHITETLCGLQLRVSPDAFFQVNTAATEVLYGLVGKCAGTDNDTTVLDVCCGTGSIGLSLAARVRRVIGLELVETAVADAKHNAESNGLTNCQFYVGRAEQLLRTILQQTDVVEAVEEGRVVAVVDPPRAGLGREVTQTLRRTTAIRRVVYVSCDPKQAMRNLIDLGRPESNQYAGYPFVARRLMPLDLFPQTPHVELVVLLERCDPCLWRQQEEAEAAGGANSGQVVEQGDSPAPEGDEKEVAESLAGADPGAISSEVGQGDLANSAEQRDGSGTGSEVTHLNPEVTGESCTAGEG